MECEHTARGGKFLSNCFSSITKLKLRKDIDKVDDPKAKALFETSAEVLTGLITAFLHYEQKAEKAWK